MKSLIVAISFIICSLACAQEPVVVGLQKSFSPSLSISITLNGDLAEIHTGGNLPISYSLTGRIEKLGDVTISYGLTGRVDQIGDAKISYSLTGRIEKLGDVTISYGLTGRVDQIGDARLTYGLTGRLVQVTGKLPRGYSIQMALLDSR
jgi:hypothetical protein